MSNSAITISIVCSTLLSLMFLLFLQRRYGRNKTRAISDLLWILLGGIGAASAISSLILTDDISDLQQTRLRIEAALSNLYVDVNSIINEHCAPDYTRLGVQESRSCTEAHALRMFIFTERHLWTLPESREQVDALRQRAITIGETREIQMPPPILEATTVGNSLFEDPLEIPHQSRSTITTDELEDFLTNAVWASFFVNAHWNCYEITQTHAFGCADHSFTVRNAFSRPLGSQATDDFLLGYHDPMARNIEVAILELTRISSRFQEIRHQWPLTFWSSRLETSRIISFILLAFAFPMRLWRSIGDL